VLCASMQSHAAPRRPPGDRRSLCAWLDGLPLSRPKRHLARDFSDGVLVAEIVKHFHPRLVDLHSYVPACSTDQKLSNWSLLNRKVFYKLHFGISEADIQKVVANRPGAIESILCALREKLEASTARVGLTGTANPGLSSVDVVRPWAGLITNPHTGRIQTPDVGNFSLSKALWASCEEYHCVSEGWAHGDRELTPLQRKADVLSPSPPFSMKTLQNQKALEKMNCCASEGPWDNLARVQQELEDKEQALAILQETVKILQMKVMKLEHLVQLKDQQIRELTRPGSEEHQVWGIPHPESARP
uniref:Sperm flagellar 1 like n=1 Tax=Nannospalax galili TaxID=1026970 RepID=A0A8C6QFN7_NANGA